MARHRRADHLTRKAKQQNYPARSVFKLEEIDRRLRILRKGQDVLDLGASPGSWTMYASKRTGPGGKVAAVDLNPVSIQLPANVVEITMDVLDADAGIIRSNSGVDAFDVVLSDMAPSTTGQKFVDQQRSFDLFMSALELAALLLKPGGSFVGKIFQSPEMDEARKRIRELFSRERIIRPRGTRSSSTELFLAGLGRVEP